MVGVPFQFDGRISGAVGLAHFREEGGILGEQVFELNQLVKVSIQHILVVIHLDDFLLEFVQFLLKMEVRGREV